MKKVFTGLLFLCFFIVRTYGQQTYADFTFNVACNGDSTTLTSTSTVLPNDSILLYLWDIDSNFVFGEMTGPEITVHLGNGPKLYSIGLKIYTKNNLMESIYKMVPISGLNADFSVANFCFGDNTAFTDLSTTYESTIYSWQWSFGDGYMSSAQNPGHHYAATGNYTVGLRVFTLNGCTDSVTQTITINPLPDYTLSFQPPDPDRIENGVLIYKIFKGQSLDVTVNTTYTDITWTPSTVQGTNHIIVDETGGYGVRVVNEFGCFADDGFYLEVIDDNTVNPMRVITPYDQTNYSLWKIKWYIQPGEQFEVKIYNRYGDEVYSNSNYQNDWDGTYEGNKLPEGSYYYYIKGKDGKTYNGAVNIVKQK